ncbi:MAG TPA: hypothetical protein VEN30_03910, partial [Paraburkholderia sp.]|nr:hypothetical protein [Paraburkholderia sp.]
MPILELPPNPSRTTGPAKETADKSSGADPQSRPMQPLKVRTGRFGELEEHELIHLLDSLDDERARARFRESIYISVIIYLAIAWFLFYGPRVLFHQPEFRDPIALMKQHDQQLTLTMPSAPPAPKAPPKIDRKAMEQLQKQARERPTPQPPAPQPAPPPQEQAHTTAPPIPTPALPQQNTPKFPQAPESPLPAAPRPSIAQNNQSAHSAIQDAIRGGLGRSGADVNGPGSAGPLQAGAEILSDTQGVDFSAYMRRLHNDIQRNWNPLIPQEVEPPLLKRGIVGIRFIILPDGEIGDIKLETTSGDVALDKAAWYAI